jgi:hypothetical protein
VDSINEDLNIFMDYKDHEKTTYQDISNNQQLVVSYDIGQLMDQQTLTYHNKKVDTKSADTGKMI